ncbi:hypothetical protein KK090_12070 [Curtobacterium flaccumfaciens pv. poinsettiae]|uniref:hypothetical protein n=1 Tax=Curtobacterium poinsettiae TaxID=159612 RepID=UPI001BDFE1B7|nr:hypothetical protein [Curtobacterium flaccumfaciens]MBT1619993.1 hypothetical protein [Curtobacterium flaccumfaciens pv. poinsettiae]
MEERALDLRRDELEVLVAAELTIGAYELGGERRIVDVAEQQDEGTQGKLVLRRVCRDSPDPSERLDSASGDGR